MDSDSLFALMVTGLRRREESYAVTLLRKIENARRGGFPKDAGVTRDDRANPFIEISIAHDIDEKHGY